MPVENAWISAELLQVFSYQRTRRQLPLPQKFQIVRFSRSNRPAMNKYTTRQFDEIMKSAGIKPISLPPRSPNLNAFCERVIQSAQKECSDKFIFVGTKSLRRAIRDWQEHYHHERNHQGLENQIPFPDENVGKLSGEIKCRKRLGGLLKYYYRDAA